jgi:hypothetical protein
MMRTRHRASAFVAVVSAALLAVTASARSQDSRPAAQGATLNPRVVAELWTEPVDLEQRNLFYGASGADAAPDPDARYESVSRDTTGFSRGYDVQDPQGRKWSVKLGPEAQTEIVVSRLIWAVGFHQPPTYYLPKWTLVEGDRVTTQPPARFRLEAAAVKKAGPWAWEENPFVGTPPLSGLFVLMVMVDNWDLKTSNNVVYDLTDTRDGASRWYVVKDIGASLGAGRRMFPGSRNDLVDFEKQPFVTRVKDDRVEFHYRGGWKQKNVPPAAVHWISERLARLSPGQWKDVFRAAGYTESDGDRYIARLRQKVADGLALR